jgi:ribosome-binding protein aMBF1 (putative translation factor)
MNTPSEENASSRNYTGVVNNQSVEDDPLRVGAIICNQREQAGISRRQLSAAAGYSASYVQKIESGHAEPSLRAFAKLAHQLKLTGAEILLIVRREAQR